MGMSTNRERLGERLRESGGAMIYSAWPLLLTQLVHEVCTPLESRCPHMRIAPIESHLRFDVDAQCCVTGEVVDARFTFYAMACTHSTKAHIKGTRGQNSWITELMRRPVECQK